MGRILIADDEPSFRAFVRDALEEAGHDVIEASDGQEAIEKIERGRFDLVLSDQRMPRLDGLGLIRRVTALPSPPTVVILTAYGTIPDAVEAVRIGAADYITKPLPTPEALLAVVDRLLRKDHDVSEIAAESATMREVLDLVDRVAPRNVPVLITGESGTGKELIARRIHSGSDRARGPFVAVNCAALPETLAESELFGHEKGAFTGADRLRKGRFEEADHGTLLLDEIGDLPLTMQAKLLRVLEQGTLRRVGGAGEIEVDVRIVAATNRDLAAAAHSGSFREDLFYRLDVVPVHLPPLRERRGDIPVLVAAILESLGRRHGIKRPSIAAETIDALKRHDWPGNVRELRNVLERALVVRGELEIRPGDLTLGPRSFPPLDLRSGKDSAEREAILEALRQADGHREEAAKLLGISVRTLYYRLRRLGLS